MKNNLKDTLEAVLEIITNHDGDLEKLHGGSRKLAWDPIYERLQALFKLSQVEEHVGETPFLRIVTDLYLLALQTAGEVAQESYHPASALVDQIVDHQRYMPELHDRIQPLANNDQVSPEIVASFRNLYAELCNEPINQNTKNFSIIADHFIKEADKTLQNHSSRTPEDIENSTRVLEYTLYGKPPMSKALKAVICGVIGAP
jgi:hypothetical protein